MHLIIDKQTEKNSTKFIKVFLNEEMGRQGRPVFPV